MIGLLIALLITLFVFYDTITTIKWVRTRSDSDKLALLMTLAITIVLMMSEYIIHLLGK